MTLDLLDTPLRVSWRLSPQCSSAVANLPTIAERLVEAGVFQVTLEGRPLAHPAVHEVLCIFAAGGLRVDLSCEGTAAELNSLGSGMPVRQIALDVASCLATDDFTVLSEQLETIRRKGFDPALLLVPRHDNVARIPRLFEFCRVHRVAKFKLPNVGIDVSVKNLSGAELVTPGDLLRLSRELPPDAASGLELEVHDLFLWELLCPDCQDSRSEYGGCQAGNSLGYIDAGGNLYPCASWPERLGSLLDHSVEALWALPARRRIREEIAETPEGCRGCRDLSICHGGCRGLARTFNRSHGSRDPLCGGPRR